MSAEVVVGTRRLGPTGMPDDPDMAEFGFDWIEVGDVRLTTEEHGLVGVRYETDGGNVAKVTITLVPASFRTVSSRQ